MKRTPLHLATLKNNIQIVKKLIVNDADINSIDDERNTCLHYAAIRGFSKLCQILIQHGVHTRVGASHESQKSDFI